MKRFGRSLGILAIILIVAAGVLAAFPAQRTRLEVAAWVWGLNHGVVKVEAADWGFLKLRSGAEGQRALLDLERNSPDDRVKIAAATVRRRYRAKGEVAVDYYKEAPADAESRFKDLYPVLDGKATPIVLAPGQTVPADLRRDLRFDIGCPQRGAASSCAIRLMDTDGDGKPEAIFVPSRNLTIFDHGRDGWQKKDRAFACTEDLPDLTAGRFRFVKAAYDDLDVGGHRVVIEPSMCGYLGGWGLKRSDPYADPRLLQQHAQAFAASPVVFPHGGVFPSSLIRDMAASHLVADLMTGTALAIGTHDGRTLLVEPTRKDVPRCALGEEGNHCFIVLADLDHDGTPEVMAIDSAVTDTGYDQYHALTLFHFDGDHWHLSGHGELCVEWGDDPARFAYGTLAPRHDYIEINGKRLAYGQEPCLRRADVVLD